MFAFAPFECSGHEFENKLFDIRIVGFGVRITSAKSVNIDQSVVAPSTAVLLLSPPKLGPNKSIIASAGRWKKISTIHSEIDWNSE